MKDVEIYIKILEEKFPNHVFELSIRNDIVFIYGDNDDTVSSFCQNLCDCMCKPVKRIAFIKPPSID